MWKTTVIHCIVGNKGFVITTIGKNGTQAQNCDHHCMQLSNNYVLLNCDFPRSVFKNTSTYNFHYGIALNAKYNFVVSYEKYVYIWYLTQILKDILHMERIIVPNYPAQRYTKNYVK